MHTYSEFSLKYTVDRSRQPAYEACAAKLFLLKMLKDGWFSHSWQLSITMQLAVCTQYRFHSQPVKSGNWWRCSLTICTRNCSSSSFFVSRLLNSCMRAMPLSTLSLTTTKHFAVFGSSWNISSSSQLDGFFLWETMSATEECQTLSWNWLWQTVQVPSGPEKQSCLLLGT